MVDDVPSESAEGDETALHESLRHALYRPGGSTADVRNYERFSGVRDAPSAEEGQPVLEDEDEDENESRPRSAATPPRGRRRLLPVVLAVSSGVVLCAGLGLAMTAARSDPTGVDATPSAESSQAVVKSTRSRQLLARDDGSRPYATGPVSITGNGRFSYIAAPGDTILGIASRFHVCASDVSGGFPLASQGRLLTAGLRITIELGPWPLRGDGTIDCVED